MFHSKKIKIISFSLALLLILPLLCGCGMTASATAASDNEVAVGMEYLGSCRGSYGNSMFYYYRDALTDVVYVQYREKASYAGMGCLTVMLDPETGLPLTVARWEEFYNQKNTEVQP